jgi:isopenicillin-N epimerase
MWALDRDIRHLNHGSFGAVPVEVMEVQTEWRARWEANPTRFVTRDLVPALEEARSVLARFVGADARNLVFVRNASTGVASVVRSFESNLRAGDEVLTTSQDYNAVRQILEFAAESTGARVVVADVPIPVQDEDQVVDAIASATSDRTRLAVIDHITSPTAVIYPIERIVSALEPDIPVLVDGAHGPGQVELNLETLGASWYTGNLHKWTCAPKGAAFLHARSDRRSSTIPTVVSHGRNAALGDREDRFQLLFDWTGTDDPSPWLSVPAALDVVGALETHGWPDVMQRNHELVVGARRLIADAVGAELVAHEDMVGSMASMVLPDGVGPEPGGDLSPLMDELVDAGYETLVMNWPRWPAQVLRISAHRYNRLSEYEDLAETLSAKVG